MTKTTRLWYVPLADVVEAAGRAALLAAEFVDAKMLTPVAAAKLLRKEVKPGDVLALMDGTQLRALARVLVLGSRVTVYRNPRLPQRAHGARNDEGAYRLPRVKRRSGKVGGDAGFGGLGGGHEQSMPDVSAGVKNYFRTDSSAQRSARYRASSAASGASSGDASALRSSASRRSR